MDDIKEYMARTGATQQEVFAGLSFYGYEKILGLIKEANEKNKKLIFYYETKDDMLCDVVSHKFE